MSDQTVQKPNDSISEEYKEGLAFAQMMPGPLAAELAMWIGFIRHGVVAASLVGIVFILPPYLIVVVIAAFYTKYNGLAVVQALFYGIGTGCNRDNRNLSISFASGYR